MVAIAAIGQNNGIGINNDLVYHIPEDMKFFRSTTTGKTVVMGRKTLESFPGAAPLPNRRNIILTRSKDFSAENAEIVHSVEELLELIKDIPGDDVFVIGGAEIYELLLPLCSKAYITQVFESSPADKFFPDIRNISGWVLTDVSSVREHKGIKFCFRTYERYDTNPTMDLCTELKAAADRSGIFGRASASALSAIKEYISSNPRAAAQHGFTSADDAEFILKSCSFTAGSLNNEVSADSVSVKLDINYAGCCRGSFTVTYNSLTEGSVEDFHILEDSDLPEDFLS